MDQSVVGASPEDAPFVRRLDEREDRRIHLGADRVAVDRSAGGLQRRRVGARQIGADGFPVLPFIGGAEDHIAADVEGIGIVW
jgi:hypothetical protein